MPPVNTFKQGAVGTTDRVANIHQESWNPVPSKALPFNRFPMLTVMDAMSKGSGTIKSRYHHWFEEAYVPYYGTVLDVYTAANLSSAYSSGGVEGTSLYVTVSAADAAQIREGDDVLITNDANNSIRIIRVNTVVVNDDTSSYFAGALAQTDTGSVLAQTDLHWGLMSDAQAEGSELPTATSHDPQEYYNVTQIMMESIEITNSEDQEMERISGTKWSRDKANAYAKLKVKEEAATLFGRYNVGTGPNGKRKSRMRGVYQWIETNDPTNIKDWRSSSGYSGAFVTAGLNWLEEVLNESSVYAQKNSRTAYLGNAAWFGINRAVKNAGDYQIEYKEGGYGIRIMTLWGLTTVLNLILSPTMSTRGFNNSMFVCDMENIRKKTFRPLKYVKDINAELRGGYNWVDGKKEGWVQETTLEVVNTRSMLWLDGIGLAHS